MPKDILLEVILGIDACGGDVVSITCDQGPKNGTLANELGITLDTIYFEHPLTPTKKIYWIQDIIHLIKLCRYKLVIVFVFEKATKFDEISILLLTNILFFVFPAQF